MVILLLHLRIPILHQITDIYREGSIVSKAGNEANYIIEETDKVQIKLTEPVYRHSCYVLHKVILKGTVVLWYIWAAKLRDRDNVTFNEKIKNTVKQD